MKWGKVAKGLLKSVAPLVMTAIGSPIAPMAMNLLKEVLGTDDESEVEKKLAEASPDTLVRLREIDSKLRERMVDAGIREQELYLGDTQDARGLAATLGKIWPQFVIFCTLTVIVAGVIYMLFYVPVPEGSKNVLFMILGNAVTAWLASIYFFTGTTKGSQDKNQMRVSDA